MGEIHLYCIITTLLQGNEPCVYGSSLTTCVQVGRQALHSFAPYRWRRVLRSGNTIPCRMTGVSLHSGDTTPCRVTGETSNSGDTTPCRITGVTFHGIRVRSRPHDSRITAGETPRHEGCPNTSTSLYCRNEHSVESRSGQEVGKYDTNRQE